MRSTATAIGPDGPPSVASATPAAIDTTKPTSSVDRAESVRTRMSHAMTPSVPPAMIAAATRSTAPSSAPSGHVISATSATIRTTDSGLSSSSGAPSANHERTLGNIRLATTDEPSRLLTTPGAHLAHRTRVRSPALQPRHDVDVFRTWSHRHPPRRA